MDTDSSDEDTDPLNESIYLHPENPYVKPYVNNDIIIYNSKPVIHGNEIINVPSQYISLAKQLEETACCFRWTIIMDRLINIVYCYHIYGVIYFLVNTIGMITILSCSFSYNKLGIKLFIYYQLLILLLKCCLLGYIIYLCENNIIYTTLDINKSTNKFILIGGQCIIIIIQFPVILYTHYYYSLLPDVVKIPKSILL